MNINLKLALPPLIGLALIILIIQTYWQPLQLEKSKSAFKKHTHESLTASEGSITQHLLERNLGSLYAGLEHMEKSHEKRWQNITLYNNNGKQLYPVFKRNSTTAIDDSPFIHIIYPLTIGGTALGRLELDVDWGQERLIVIDNINGIRNMVISLLIISLLIGTLSQYQIIYQPLKKLSRAAHSITGGNFKAELPLASNDEIGDLTHSFNTMMVELEFEKKVINHHAIVSVVDKNGLITYINNKFLTISGYTRKELIGQTDRMIKSDIHPPEFYKEMWATITQGNIWHGEVCNLNKMGEEYWVNSTIVPFLDKQGVAERYMSIRTDISEQKKAEEALKHLANHDTLTGLPTRRLAKEYLSQALAEARRDNKKAAVLFIDLDGFKAVNDSLGHQAGDFLLVGVAERLTQCVREVDTVARIGGDEFIIILTGIANRENVALVAQKIIDALSSSFTLNGKTASIGASIGIALYPDHEQEPEALIKCADDMMYKVKRKGKNGFAFSDGV